MLYTAHQTAALIGLTIPGFYALRRRMAANGVVIGVPTGVRTFTGEIVVYSDDDIAFLQAYRAQHSPRVKQEAAA